jgi:hypothetical protein
MSSYQVSLESNEFDIWMPFTIINDTGKACSTSFLYTSEIMFCRCCLYQPIIVHNLAGVVNTCDASEHLTVHQSLERENQYIKAISRDHFQIPQDPTEDPPSLAICTARDIKKNWLECWLVIQRTPDHRKFRLFLLAGWNSSKTELKGGEAVGSTVTGLLA